MTLITTDYYKIMTSTKKEIQNLSPEFFNTLHPNVIKAIPETIYQYITLEQARGLNTLVLRRLPSWLLESYKIQDGETPYELVREIDGKKIPILAKPIAVRLRNSSSSLKNKPTTLYTKPFTRENADNLLLKDVKFLTQIYLNSAVKEHFVWQEKKGASYSADFDEILNIINNHFVPNEFEKDKRFDHIPALISLPNLLAQSNLIPVTTHAKVKHLSYFKFGGSVRYIYKDAYKLLLMLDKLQIASKSCQAQYKATNKMPRIFFENLYKELLSYDDIEKYIHSGELKLYEDESHILQYDSAINLISKISENGYINALPIYVEVKEYFKNLYADDTVVELVKNNMKTFEYNGKLFFKYNLNMNINARYMNFRKKLISVLAPYYRAKFGTKESQRHFRESNMIPDLIVECLIGKPNYKGELWTQAYYEPNSLRTYTFPAYCLGTFDIGYMYYDKVINGIDKDFIL